MDDENGRKDGGLGSSLCLGASVGQMIKQQSHHGVLVCKEKG